MLPHVAECITHELSNEVCCMYYLTQVNPGLGGRKVIDHIMDLVNRYFTDPVFAQWNPLLGRVEVQCPRRLMWQSRLSNGWAMSVGRTVPKRMTSWNGSRRLRKKGNLRLPLDGEKRHGPPPIIQPINTFTPRDGLDMVGLSPLSLTSMRDLKWEIQIVV